MNANALLDQARAVLLNAHAPYSGFHVGAALLDAEGRVHLGVNVENAAYGSTICAERGAVMRAVADGRRDFVAIAIIGRRINGDPATELACYPCGSCRQVLFEMMPEGVVLVQNGPGAAPQSLRIRDLLPAGFAFP